MEAFLQFTAGVGLFVVGIKFGYWKGWYRGAKVGYHEGMAQMEKSLFEEITKLREEGIIITKGR